MAEMAPAQDGVISSREQMELDLAEQRPQTRAVTLERICEAHHMDCVNDIIRNGKIIRAPQGAQ
jgi:hypothetical protein